MLESDGAKQWKEKKRQKERVKCHPKSFTNLPHCFTYAHPYFRPNSCSQWIECKSDILYDLS